MDEVYTLRMDYKAFFLIFFLCVSPATSVLGKNLPSDSLQKINGNTRGDTIKGSKLVRGQSAGAGNGAGKTSPAEGGNNGENRSPYVQGGAVIPLYGNSKHHHHGAGNRIQNCLGLPIFIITTMVSLLYI